MGRESNIFDQIRRNQNYDPHDQGTFVKNEVFVGMAFSLEQSEEIFRSISEACRKLRLDARRVDNSVGSNIILFEIIERIEHAEFLIFDLTGERPNVYYELGFAHGVGNNAEDVLVIARSDAEIHFDVSPFRIHKYSDIQSCGDLVKRQLESMIHRTRRN